MPYNQRPSEYFGWYFRYNTRTTYSNFGNAGMDLFASPADQNQDAWLDLTNVLPAVSGGFRRRWGIQSVTTGLHDSTGRVISPIRTFAYNAAQDATDPTHTQNTNLVIYSDSGFAQVLTDTGTTLTGGMAYEWGIFGATNKQVGAVESRQFLYVTSGEGATTKVQLNKTAIPPVSTNWGIQDPPSISAHSGTLTIVGYGAGGGYSGTQTLTFSDALGSGTGATGYAFAGWTNGRLSHFNVSAGGSSYEQPNAAVPAPGTGTDQAYAVAYADLNNANSTFGKVVAVLPAGPIALASGRTYTYALMNSTTGHVSDISSATVTTPSNQALPSISGVIFSPPTTYSPTGQSLQPGWSGIDIKIQLDSALSLDPQVDTVLLLATADGGSLENLYLVASIPLSSFTGTPPTYTYSDTLPDSYSTMYTSGPTLLTQEIYQSTDGFGNNYGIVGNLPAPTSLLYPTLHQGYIFGTDGKTVFYSKSIVDVTTASGLITSKWEEAWPADNQLPVAIENDTITALKSDGINLHIGTTKAIYTCIGSDASSFSIPNQQFAETGVLNNDLWTVVYAQGQPAGFMWLTPDYKVMWSDFNTYQDIGTPIYPLLQNWDTTFTSAAKLLSFTQGPYNFVVLCYKRLASQSSEFLIYETSMRKWYRWVFGSPTGLFQPEETGPLCAFVYQHPSNGARYLYFFTLSSGVTQSSRIYEAPPTIPAGYTLNLYRFDPATISDLGNSSPIGWNVQTTWQYLDDPQVIKVLNQIDFMSSERGLQGTVYGAYRQADFASPTWTITSAITNGPIGGSSKMYLAGQNTRARYYSFAFTTTNPNTSDLEVLDAFTVEHCPISRM